MRTTISSIVLVILMFAESILASDTNSVPNVSSKHGGPFFEVFGGVHNPGRYVWTNGVTVLDGIRVAGGFDHFASSRIKIRHSDGSVEIFSRQLLEATNQPPRLQLRDEVVVFERERIY
jgi:protein involved in polysaccharide export with SLBB domain